MCFVGIIPSLLTFCPSECHLGSFFFYFFPPIFPSFPLPCYVTCIFRTSYQEDLTPTSSQSYFPPFCSILFSPSLLFIFFTFKKEKKKNSLFFGPRNKQASLFWAFLPQIPLRWFSVVLFACERGKRVTESRHTVGKSLMSHFEPAGAVAEEEEVPDAQDPSSLAAAEDTEEEEVEAEEVTNKSVSQRSLGVEGTHDKDASSVDDRSTKGGGSFSKSSLQPVKGGTSSAAHLQAEGSWIAKIESAARTATPDQPRACTPLRPSDSMVQRIPPTRSSAQIKKSFRAQPASTAAALAVPVDGRPVDSSLSHVDYSPLANPEDDSFSRHEKEVLNEINKLRENPADYATKMKAFLLLGEPYVTSEARVNLAQLESMLQGANAQLVEATRALALLDDSQKKEIAVLKDRWAVEDAEKAKKSKGKPAPSATPAAAKKGAPAANVKDEKEKAPVESVDAERDVAVQQIIQRNKEQRTALTNICANLKASVSQATLGVSILKTCIARVESAPPMKPLCYNRGMSLAARHACSDDEEAPQDPAVHCALYGAVEGSLSTCCHYGREKVRQTVMELLLSLKDPKRRGGRQVLLNPQFTLVGVGWQRHRKHGSVTCVIAGDAFEEFAAISERPHMPLNELRALLPMALGESPQTFVTLRTTFNITPIAPLTHPVACGNRCTVKLRCDPEVTVFGTLHYVNDPPPKAPVTFSGETLVQRDGDVLELSVVIPSRGSFRFSLFARHETEAAGAFTFIGFVRLNANSWEHVQPPLSFPLQASDFFDRRCRIESPLDGALEAEKQYTFSIVIPQSNYLSHELQRLSDSLELATKHTAATEQEVQRLAAEKNDIGNQTPRSVGET